MAVQIQLVRVVTPSGAAGSSVNAGNLVSTASPVVLGVSSATTVKVRYTFIRTHGTPVVVVPD